MTDKVELKDIEKGDETTEKSPLNEDEETKETNGKEGKGNPLITALQDPKTRLVFVVAAAVILLLIVASAVIGVIVAGSQPNSAPWIEDSIPRMLRLVPTPNKARNQIQFRSGHGSEGKGWPEMTNEINNLFDMFDRDNVMGKKNVTYCDGRSTPPHDERFTCFFDSSDIKKQCNQENDYGYADGSPCIFIQFNHVANFTPEIFTKQDLEDQNMPEGLRAGYQFKGLWVDCKPNDVIDVENSGFKVIGNPEFPRHFFPFKGHPDYMAPFFAIKLEKPTPAMTIGITCRVYSRNLVYNATVDGLNDTFVDEKPIASAILPFNVNVE